MPAVIPNLSVEPIRVFVIDDTVVVTHLLARELSRQFDVQLVGTATNITKAAEQIYQLKPDVIILDIEIAELEGAGFVAELVRDQGCQIVVLTSATAQGAAKAMDAFAAGAVDVVSKPSKEYSIEYVVACLIERIRASRHIQATTMTRTSIKSPKENQPKTSADDTVLAIGASTGGMSSLGEVLTRLPANSPGAVIVHHLPAGITGLLAERLNQLCDIEVKEAITGDTVRRGRALIAPGGRHMLLRRSTAGYFVQIKDGPEVFHQKPSVDVLFNSVAKHAGDHAVGAMLGGVGSDGSQGLLNMRNAGGHTLIVDEKSEQYQGAERAVPLTQIAGTMLEMAIPRAIIH